MAIHRRMLAVVLAVALMPFAASAADLVVRVEGLTSRNGDVHIALYDTPDAFPKSDGMHIKAEAPITLMDGAPVAIWAFRGLKPGRHAVAVFHDEDGNDDFNQGIFGIPMERYGFSNGATVFLGPPSFDAAAFDVMEPETTIVVRLDR